MSIEQGTDYLDRERRTLRTEVFTDPALFKREMKTVFRKSWLYLCHESQLTNTGDYVTALMGQDPVVVWKGKDDKIRVFLNSCPHKGPRVCRQDRGNARQMVCPYHAWTFSSLGRFAGAPGMGDRPEDLDKPNLALIEAPRVETYHGLVFGCFDPSAPSLLEYLGDMKFYLDVIFGQAGRPGEVFDAVNRWTMKTNWKFPAEQSTGDPTHQHGAHMSVAQLGLDLKFGADDRDFVVAFPHGHGVLNLGPRNRILMSRFQRELIESCREDLSERQGQLLGCLYIATIFPNFSLVGYPGFLSIRCWQPIDVDTTQIWSWGIAPRDAPQNAKDNSRRQGLRYFSPAGTLEQDDVEIWEDCYRGVIAPYRSEFPLVYPFVQNEKPALDGLPGMVSAIPSEHSNFRFYDRWQQVVMEEGA